MNKSWHDMNPTPRLTDRPPGNTMQVINPYRIAHYCDSSWIIHANYSQFKLIILRLNLRLSTWSRVDPLFVGHALVSEPFKLWWNKIRITFTRCYRSWLRLQLRLRIWQCNLNSDYGYDSNLYCFDPIWLTRTSEWLANVVDM